MTTTSERPTATDDKKAVRAKTREQGRIIRSYLEALEVHKPKRGRKRATDKIARRIKEIDAELADADALKRVHLTQERLDLSAELSRSTRPDDMPGLEAAFTKVVLPYSATKGISYVAWREVGVPASVLARAGIGRAR